MSQNKDNGHFITCSTFNVLMEYPLHCSFEDLLRNKIAELSSESVDGESSRPMMEEVRKNIEQIPAQKKSQDDTKCVRMMRPDGYYVMLKPKIPYPRVSFLTHAQQAQYYILKQKVTNQILLGISGSAATGGQDASALEELRSLVLSEQRDFIQYLRACFDQLKEDYKYVDITAQQYVKHILFSRECRLNSLPAYYSTLTRPVLQADGPVLQTDGPVLQTEGPAVTLICEKIVLNSGRIPRIVVPIITNHPERKTRAICDHSNINELYQRYPVNVKPTPFVKQIVLHDLNCAALATKYRCQFVLSGSAMTSLLSTVNGKFTNEHWIPIVVKEYELLDGAEPELFSVVYLNKPFKLHNLNSLEKNQLFHKTGLKYVLHTGMKSSQEQKQQQQQHQPYPRSSLLPHHTHFRNARKTDHDPVNSKTRIVTDRRTGRTDVTGDDLFGENVQCLETFGTEIVTETPTVRKLEEKKKDEDDPTSEKQSAADIIPGRKRPMFGSTSPAKKARAASLMDMVNPEAVTLLDAEGRRTRAKTHKKLTQTARTTSTTGTINGTSTSGSTSTENAALDGILASQCKLLNNEQRARTQLRDNAGAARVELENEREYVQWRVPKCSTYSVWSLSDLRLLIRTNHHGDVRDASTNKTKELYTSAKMEYQPTMGGEVLTLEECMKVWINSFIRQKCHVLRARIHAYTSEILTLEGLEHDALLPPGCPYSPQLAQTVLKQILTHLVSLVPGKYLLKCSADTNEIEIMTQHPKLTGGVLNFRKHMSERAQRAAETLPRWLPVDTELEMPYHRLFNRIPATFQPADGLKPAHFVKQKKNKKKKKHASKK